MPERYAKPIKVLIRQFTENIDIDVALDLIQGKVNPQVRPIRDMQKFSQ